MKHVMVAMAALFACSVGCDRRDTADKGYTPPTETVKEATQVKDPVCGMMVSIKGTPEEKYQGQVFHFCSKECEDKFQKSPESFMQARSEATQVKDPVCGMTVSTKGTPEENYKGNTFHFCSNECEDKFQKSPESYLQAK